MDMMLESKHDRKDFDERDNKKEGIDRLPICSALNIYLVCFPQNCFLQQTSNHTEHANIDGFHPIKKNKTSVQEITISERDEEIQVSQFQSCATSKVCVDCTPPHDLVTSNSNSRESLSFRDFMDILYLVVIVGVGIVGSCSFHREG